MTGQENRSVAQPKAARYVTARHVEKTATARCLCYGVWSELTASPHELDPRDSARGRIGAGKSLPGADDLDDIIIECCGLELAQLKSEYSSLFEVGDHGPPAPIREDLITGQQAGTREDIVRFYDYFGYQLGERYAWAPDHLSIELEFMHFLCFQESQGGDNVLSYQLAQADFSARHLGSWLPLLQQRVAAVAPGSFYARLIDALAGFVVADSAWQRSTIRTGEGDAGSA